MRYAVCDTETTGMDQAEDRLVEIAAVHSDGRMLTTLVSPGDRKISFGAMATHHITPKQLVGAPSAMDAMEIVGLAQAKYECEDCGGSGFQPSGVCGQCVGGVVGVGSPADYLVFHNAEYDRGFLPEYLREIPYICTWRCALHLVPNAESHSNGALWYELGLDHEMPPEAGLMPHRALFDAIMTKDILEFFLSNTIYDSRGEITRGIPEALDTLARLTVTPVLLTKCRFGKHRDERWEDIPSSYMEWVLREGSFDKDTVHTCETWLQRRGRR